MSDAPPPTPEAPAVITVEDLAIGWGATPLLSDLNFTVRRGDVFVILGGSGCGKSTLLRHLIGLQEPMAGRIHIEGFGAPRLTTERPPFGMMFQSGALFGSMTLAENVALPLSKWTDLEPSAVDAVVRAKLRLVGLDGFENHLPAEISGGMQKRAGIARALAFDPPLLFLDEPSAGLDPITAVELDETIHDLSQFLDTTLVIVTHELASVYKIATRCIMLDKDAGGMIASGDPRTLRDSSDVQYVKAFFNRCPVDEATGEEVQKLGRGGAPVGDTA